MIYRFTKSGEKVIKISSEIAISLGHTYIGTEHLLYGLAKEKNGIASKVLEKQNINYKNILEKIEEIIGRNDFIKAYNIGFTPRLKKVIENSYEESKKIRSDFIGTEHLLIGIIKESDSIAGRILEDLGIDITKIYKELVNILNEIEKEDFLNFSEEKNNIPENIKQFGVDLTKKAREGRLDPVIGREVETERLIEILLRRMKNNPCLIGEPGVGKTAVVEGLAQRIINKNVPEILKNKQVITLDISSLVAGAKYRGDFEERIKKVLNEVKKSKQIILFIDEIHTIVGAGAAEGAIDAANILKPLLARGDIQVIGATTLNEYRKYIEKDSALERRFQQVIVNEPTREDTIRILNGLADKYEAHHNVKISEEAIEAAVDLSIRYVSDRFLPDKAIDLIDEACAKAKLELFTEPKEIKDIADKLLKIENEKNSAINIQDFEIAANLRDEYIKLNTYLEDIKNKWKNENLNKIISIKKENISDVLSRMTGIPVNKINETENKKLISLEEKIHENIIGQQEAVKAISKAIRRSRVGLKDFRKTNRFIFVFRTYRSRKN